MNGLSCLLLRPFCVDKMMYLFRSAEAESMALAEYLAAGSCFSGILSTRILIAEVLWLRFALRPVSTAGVKHIDKHVMTRCLLLLSLGFHPAVWMEPNDICEPCLSVCGQGHLCPTKAARWNSILVFSCTENRLRLSIQYGPGQGLPHTKLHQSKVTVATS